MTTVAFRARLIIEDGGTREIEIWDDELSPFEGGKRPIRDQVSKHFRDYSEQNLRELLEIPAEGNYEVVLKGTISGYGCNYEYQEYDEQIDIEEIKSQKIPDSWYKYLDS